MQRKYTDDTLVNFGSAVKALGPVTNDGKVKVGGYLILWGSASQKDATGDYFTPETYLGPFDGNNQETLFNHGMPVTKHLEYLTDHRFNPITTKRDDIGLFAETVLDMADEYERKIYELVKMEKLGWSSGSSPHRIKKMKDGRITQWPVYEGSLTPEPAEPRNKGGIVPLKSLVFTKAMGTTDASAGGALVPNPANRKKEIPVSRNTKAADEVCENPDCDNYGQSHANCQCHKTVKGDGSETDYEVSEQEDQNYPDGSGHADKSAMTGTGGDYGVYEGNREEAGVTTKGDYALYEANREEVGVTTGDDSKKDDHTFGIDAGLVHGHIGLSSLSGGETKDDGEIVGHNIGPVRVSLTTAKSLTKPLRETLEYLKALVADPRTPEVLRAGHKYHATLVASVIRSTEANARKSVLDADAGLEAEIAKLTPAEREWAERELAAIKKSQDARLNRQKTRSRHDERLQRAAQQRRV